MVNDDNKMDIKEIRSRISEIISRMSEAQSRKFLKGLEKWQQFNLVENRKYQRKKTFILVDCSNYRIVFTDFIQNLSASGLFIETRLPFYVGEELSLTFSLTDIEDHVKITGKIVRVDSKGIGVQFEELLPDN
jgi:Tfp pilus assembly protein PilZ